MRTHLQSLSGINNGFNLNPSQQTPRIRPSCSIKITGPLLHFCPGQFLFYSFIHLFILFVTWIQFFISTYITVQYLAVGALPVQLPLCLWVCICLCCIKVNLLLFFTSVQGVPAVKLNLSAWPPSTACWFTWETTQTWSWRYKGNGGQKYWHLKQIYWVSVSKLASGNPQIKTSHIIWAYKTYTMSSSVCRT